MIEYKRRNFKQDLIEKGIKDFNCHYYHREGIEKISKLIKIKIIVAKIRSIIDQWKQQRKSFGESREEIERKIKNLSSHHSGEKRAKFEIEC